MIEPKSTYKKKLFDVEKYLSNFILTNNFI